MAVICLDAGTTMIKAIGYDDGGRETAVAREATTVHRPRPGWAEQDMAAVWDAVVTTVRSVAEQLDDDVDYVAFTAQGDGSWLVDGQGAPTGPAILWNDGRGSAILDRWTKTGLLEQTFAVNGSLTSSGMPNVILSWLRQHDPERLDRSAVSLTCGGWLFAQLTGELGIDYSDASAPFLDIRSRRYSTELLSFYDMEWACELLPDLRDDDHRVGSLTGATAELVGLRPGTPVIMSSYDIASTAIGTGAVSAGQACCILGTTLCTEIVLDEVVLGERAAGITVALGLPGKYLRALPTLAGTEVVSWTCALLGFDDPSRLSELAAGCDPGAGGLAFLPYLSPAGERAPFLDPLARGAFLGLSFDHKPEHVARAVLEGLTLVIQDCLAASGSEPTELMVAGGGAASPFWLQMIADVTGVPVSRSTDTEAGAKGAFLMGQVATGRAATVEEIAERYVRTRDTFHPDAERAQRYAELFNDFVGLRDTTAAVWPRLGAMRER